MGQRGSSITRIKENLRRMKRVRALIHGRVQGVGYRAWTARTASSMGLTGWVRNTPDGSVEAEIQGDDPTVLKFLDQLQVGPRFSAVSDIEVFELSCAKEEREFTIVR